MLAIVIRDGKALLVRRANSPDQGRWGFPGGKIDAGETVLAAAMRELAEETSVIAEAIEPLTVLDVFERRDPENPTSPLKRHFILIAVRCAWRAGEPRAGDDALEAAWWPLDEIGKLDTSRDVARVAFMAAARPGQLGYDQLASKTAQGPRP
ncbi:NUDIX hydrolase [Rhodoligotrophos defluvii]|uniref:NUDIX hydrolase n=1 Tax=Rhodoligotrophos defluvii TaxID=2561934 RepID=UPI001EEFD8E2|nr:NUDIX hydrolase [Rhodoligotrophos defluvii]